MRSGYVIRKNIQAPFGQNITDRVDSGGRFLSRGVFMPDWRFPFMSLKLCCLLKCEFVHPRSLWMVEPLLGC